MQAISRLKLHDKQAERARSPRSALSSEISKLGVLLPLRVATRLQIIGDDFIFEVFASKLSYVFSFIFICT